MQADKPTIDINETAILNCTASGGYPPIHTVSWIKNGRLLEKSEGSTVLISTDGVYPTQYGEYTCQVNNSVITVEKTLVITAQGNHQASLFFAY